MSLEPEKSTFLLKDGGNDNVEVYSTKMIFNNAASGTLNFENNYVKPINFAFDTMNLVDWVDGHPKMTICGTTLEVPKYLLSNHRIGHIEFINGSKSNLGDSSGVEKAGNAHHPTPRPAGQLVEQSGLCSGQLADSSGILNPESEMSCYSLGKRNLFRHYHNHDQKLRYLSRTSCKLPKYVPGW